MNPKKQKIILIVIALGIFICALLLLIPAILGMGVGYDAAMIEKTVEKNCDCKEVKYVRIQPTSETLMDDIKSGDITKNFSMRLIDCDYETLELLQEEVLAVLNEKALCDSKNITFSIEDFKGAEAGFNVNNCDLITK